MGIFAELRNEALIRELALELNTPVLLFGFDGFTYFGNLQAIDHCRIAVLTPAAISGVTDVEIQTPGGELEFVSFARVDLWQIIGKGTAISDDPFDTGSGSGKSGSGGSGKSGSNKGTGTGTGSGTRVDVVPEAGDTDRQESHSLIHQLKRMIGDCVVITTLGGFLFEGTLTDIRCELAILTVDEIIVPGTSAISKSNVKSAVVNLEAITSASSQTVCTNKTGRSSGRS
jgi:small nuclear ribonucleoprotein (snRNP)-like protein